jgi:Spy/CpxP family protein refolding chaperone
VRRRALWMLLLLLSPAVVQAQQGGGDSAARRAALEARRDSLETAVMKRFVDQLTRELRLGAEQRVETERVLREGGLRRRELMRSSGELRTRLYRAIRSPETAEADYLRLLLEHENLRQREQELWRREQEELARVLTPRQRAQFLVQWARFEDQVRDIIAQQMRPGGPPRH